MTTKRFSWLDIMVMVAGYEFGQWLSNLLF